MADLVTVSVEQFDVTISVGDAGDVTGPAVAVDNDIVL